MMRNRYAYYSDYYPFGMEIEALSSNSSENRYGLQSQEKDNEIKGNGNSINYKYRMYDPRVARFFATDPLTKSYPMLTPYQFSSNNPCMLEIEGLEGQAHIVNTHDNKQITFVMTVYYLASELSERDNYGQSTPGNPDYNFDIDAGFPDNTHYSDEEQNKAQQASNAMKTDYSFYDGENTWEVAFEINYESVIVKPSSYPFVLGTKLKQNKNSVGVLYYLAESTTLTKGGLTARRKLVLVIGGATPTTMVHEVMHAFGLPHIEDMGIKHPESTSEENPGPLMDPDSDFRALSQEEINYLVKQVLGALGDKSEGTHTVIIGGTEKIKTYDVKE